MIKVRWAYDRLTFIEGAPCMALLSLSWVYRVFTVTWWYHINALHLKRLHSVWYWFIIPRAITRADCILLFYHWFAVPNGIAWRQVNTSPGAMTFPSLTYSWYQPWYEGYINTRLHLQKVHIGQDRPTMKSLSVCLHFTGTVSKHMTNYKFPIKLYVRNASPLI